ncbi:hypothetical protein AV540_20545 [Brevibacillus parabrevis]|nr:hypothetical protein AV540_20545 [Brevibacillus parabrevis]MDH6353655.1 Ca2+/Na+ antiporter [Brevibacillus sp. 1238]
MIDVTSIQFIAPIVVLLIILYSTYKYRFQKYNLQNTGICLIAALALLTIRVKDLYTYSMLIVYALLFLLFVYKLSKNRHKV